MHRDRISDMAEVLDDLAAQWLAIADQLGPLADPASSTATATAAGVGLRRDVPALISRLKDRARRESTTSAPAVELAIRSCVAAERAVASAMEGLGWLNGRSEASDLRDLLEAMRAQREGAEALQASLLADAKAATRVARDLSSFSTRLNGQRASLPLPGSPLGEHVDTAQRMASSLDRLARDMRARAGV
jgi:hypothetical protein